MRASEEQLWAILTQRLKARHFVLLSSVYRHRSLRKVADEMNLSQPAITKALKEMEEIVGAELFERTSRGLVPTPVAYLLVPRSAAFLEDLRNLAADLTAFHAGFHGTVRIGIIQFISYSLLTKAMDALRQQGFNYRFVVHDGHTDALVDMLSRHELDCVIARLTHVNSSEMEQEILYTQQAVLLSNRAYQSPNSRKLTINDFATAEWVLPPKATPTRRAFEEMLVRSGVVIREPLVETISVAAIKATLASNEVCVTMLPRDLAEEIAAEGLCRILPVELDFLLPAVSLITRRAAQSDRTLGALKRVIRAVAP
ncbi:LysR family transcriptional regulator [Paraburkholderia sediminicola]|uniref:LysR family transcriptional regulator n=1 Tax=Paraburkholderia sediminicola TaxID=458836 RepID=UPI0038B97D01